MGYFRETTNTIMKNYNADSRNQGVASILKEVDVQKLGVDDKQQFMDKLFKPFIRLTNKTIKATSRMSRSVSRSHVKALLIITKY